MCTDASETTLVLDSDRACPDCLHQALAGRVAVLTEALEDLVGAEVEALQAGPEAEPEVYGEIVQATDRGALVLEDRTWIAPAFHAPSPMMN